ncbi:Proline--tRNA ligase [Candidatus Ecksteinia adelgidicola]|nr:Proline--tRNA ligase [Candidatus Ecksteinia adelgidicola]
MRTSQYLLFTQRECPSNTEIISHKLMLRAGIIRKLSSGFYTWLPTGQRILKKIENIVREEMHHANVIEISMPIAQPSSIWKKSGRWEKYGKELVRFIDRNNGLFALGPTHEEVITHLIRNEINSYKQLPIKLFQIKTKFRDEIRPRFGVMRAREFLMKDAYSFHISQNSLQETYNLMYKTYSKIFKRIGLNFRPVYADTGSIGGIMSHEFQVIADSGEDNIAFSTDSEYAANVTFAEAVFPKTIRKSANETLRIVDISNSKTIIEFIKKFQLPLKRTIKTLLVHASNNQDYKLIALLVRGDHVLNKIKVEKIKQVATPLTFATEEEIQTTYGVGSNSIGPINLKHVHIIADRSVVTMSDFFAGANIKDKYYFGINWNRDLPLPQVEDIRNVVEGDFSPDGKGTLLIKRGIEVGHIFQLDTKYSKKMKATVQGKDGQHHVLKMGCYGIGITRLVAAVVEQNYDEYGIIWPNSISPFQLAIIPIDIHKYFHVKNLSEYLYNVLSSKNIEVLFDDRQERPGVMLTDMKLIGIPHFIIINNNDLNSQNIEYINRQINEKKMIKINDIIDFLLQKIQL